MLRCIPFLLFDGNCAEALAFYQDSLGGTLQLTKLGETPMKDRFPLSKHQRIINAHLKSGSIEISATDWMASPDFDPLLGNMSALFVTADSVEELRPVFDKLARGARQEHFRDLQSMPFGIYGQFYDRYGVQWVFRSNA